jgi:carboxypeptidase D
LKGLVIGNGWIAPIEQYNSYIPFAYEKGIVKQGSDVDKKVLAQKAVCDKRLEENNGADRVATPECEEVLQDILRLTLTKDKEGRDRCINMYDVRLTDTSPSCGMNWPPDLTNVQTYLRNIDVLKALNMGGISQPGWVECNGNVGGAFDPKAKPSYQILPDILKEVPVLLFSGAEDLICNHLGTEDLISNMKWNGGSGFEISPGTWAPRRDWTVDNEKAGFWQEARNLTYVLFYNSSHMVPFDYPRRTRDMLDRFMGVDIGSIGGEPTNSRIDGEKGVETSVGGHPNSTAAAEAEQERLTAAKWDAYYKSGEVALVIVAIAASVWGWFIWRQRRQRHGYTGLFGGFGASTDRLRRKMDLRSRNAHNDVEAADFDEAELDDLANGRVNGHYDIGSDSEDENDQANGNVVKDKGKGPEH